VKESGFDIDGGQDGGLKGVVLWIVIAPVLGRARPLSAALQWQAGAMRRPLGPLQLLPFVCA